MHGSLLLTFVLALCVASSDADEAPAAAGKSWYVAPAGDDAAPGTLEVPFATIQRAQQAASPGDTVFIRGGLFQMTEAQIAQSKDIFARVIVLDKSGEPGRPITYRAYQDEKPVFGCFNIRPVGQRVTAFYVSGSWLRLVGLEVGGVQVTIKEHTQSICFESQGSHNVFERLAMGHNQAIGIYHVHGKDNLFLNCDAWRNWDQTSEDGKGKNVDGFGCHPTKGSTGNVFRGCCAWFNSDDGFDCIGAQEPVTFEHCWAFFNGSSVDFQRLGDGNGFKAGGYGSRPANEVPNPAPRHVIRYCLAVGNKANGFYANHHPGGCDWINNTAYRNETNFNMQGRLADNRTEVDGYGHKLINNLSYGSRRDLAAIDMAKCELAGNSFTLNLKLTDKDFLSVDADSAWRTLFNRQPDGSLPVTHFMRPGASNNPLARAGVDNGLGQGERPDIGALPADRSNRPWQIDIQHSRPPDQRGEGKGRLCVLDGDLVFFNFGQRGGPNDPPQPQFSLRFFHEGLMLRVKIVALGSGVEQGNVSEKLLAKDGWYVTADFATDPPQVILTEKPTKGSRWKFSVGIGAHRQFIKNEDAPGAAAWLDMEAEGKTFRGGIARKPILSARNEYYYIGDADSGK